MPGVTVVVPSWNRKALLAKLLERLGRQSQPPEEVVVVDNGSTDGSAEAAEASGARVIRMGWNAGFSRAVNRGVQAVRTPWVAVVNNDVEPETVWLEQLLNAVRDGDSWFACGKLLNAERRDLIDGTFDTVCRGGCAWRAGHGRPDGAEWNVARPIRFAPLTAALFRTELFEKVGWLDERFESYLEDVDFGLRCARAGYPGMYAPEAVALHAGSATLGAWHPETVRRISRNQVLLVAKQFPPGGRWPVLVAQALWGLVAMRHGAGLAYLRGKWEGIRQFKAVRAAAGEAPRTDVAAIVGESERELHRLQRETGFDLYWKLYFALT